MMKKCKVSYIASTRDTYNVYVYNIKEVIKSLTLYISPIC